MARERIVVAMSGGVDSAVAAARLHEAGHDVVGVTLHLWDYPDEGEEGAHTRCCAPEDQYDARRTADALGFPHYTFDRRALFAQRVVEPFVEAYLAGETPSPCTACNRGVKLAELFAIADRLGARQVATGHYARITRDEASGAPRLAAGFDETKDQSYFLYATPRAWLERLVFPLGESTKGEVRAEAIQRDLPGARKGESQELCFVGAGAGAYARFVEERALGRVRPGPIVDESGKVVGEHAGIHRFTVGQRKGLGVALGRPVFVSRIDPAQATVHLAESGDALASASADLEDLVLAEGVSLPTRARVRVRYRHEGAAGLVTSAPSQRERARVTFDAPVRAVTTGQVAVLYDEAERVLGGGRIARAPQC
ncbi:MAG TPA: tRNA 2-thiouridine(34) synthase MnmA [Polyangiaceae bacterium]|jgi:tRNA-specific 2-thiouridylase